MAMAAAKRILNERLVVERLGSEGMWLRCSIDDAPPSAHLPELTTMSLDITSLETRGKSLRGYRPVAPQLVNSQVPQRLLIIPGDVGSDVTEYPQRLPSRLDACLKAHLPTTTFPQTPTFKHTVSRSSCVSPQPSPSPYPSPPSPLNPRPWPIPSAARPRWIRWSRLPRSAPAQFPGLGGFDGPSCSNQNGLINAAILTETHCHGSGAGTGPMRCGNQGGDPNGGGLLGGLLGPGNSLLNVNALSTVDCYN
ncbi:hypothetical protein H4Q26_015153 [Puccinia striiformis f. sp. tritici PST-130]|nr:hypothetical protein H4Q26_015153 [Puccinia striiformis f. sp. tritici PST-130]